MSTNIPLMYSMFGLAGTGDEGGSLWPYYGIGVTNRIGREMLCLPYAGFIFSFF